MKRLIALVTVLVILPGLVSSAITATSVFVTDMSKGGVENAI